MLKEIVIKVRELYRKYGIRSVSMDDVAKELGISKKTLYQYVKDKNDLVEKALISEIEFKRHVIDEILEKDVSAIEQLFMISRSMNTFLKETNPATNFDLKKYYPELWKKYHGKKLEGMYETVVQNIKKGKSEGIYRTDINEQIIGKLHVSRLDNAMENEFFTLNEFTSPEFFKELFEYHIRGIANAKGIKILEENIDKLKT